MIGYFKSPDVEKLPTREYRQIGESLAGIRFSSIHVTTTEMWLNSNQSGFQFLLWLECLRLRIDDPQGHIWLTIISADKKKVVGLCIN